MRRGFTLIELLVVVAVVAAMLGAAVLSVSTGTQSARLRNAVRGVKQFGRHARAMALLRQAPYVMTVSEVWNGGDFVKSRIEVKGTAATSGAARGGGTMKDVTGKYVGGEDGGDVETASSLANLGEEPKDRFNAFYRITYYRCPELSTYRHLQLCEQKSRDGPAQMYG